MDNKLMKALRIAEWEKACGHLNAAMALFLSTEDAYAFEKEVESLVKKVEGRDLLAEKEHQSPF